MCGQLVCSGFVLVWDVLICTSVVEHQNADSWTWLGVPTPCSSIFFQWHMTDETLQNTQTSTNYNCNFL